jgi:hypothetical protein
MRRAAQTTMRLPPLIAGFRDDNAKSCSVVASVISISFSREQLIEITEALLVLELY